ncbi:MAG: type II toxin-antitoxin system YoeB family toxin [Flavobacterium sp.]
MIVELSLNPKIRIGKPEQLKHNLSGFWSRRINKKIELFMK